MRSSDSYLIDVGTSCPLVIRGPRAVAASAGFGACRRAVGDRYPIRLLLGLWHESAHHWLTYQHDPPVLTVLYEDVVKSPPAALSAATAWLGLPDLEPGMLAAPLLDHAGEPWPGNSSIDRKAGVDAGSLECWREVLDDEETRFTAACTRRDKSESGYPFHDDLGVTDIESFQEQAGDVHPVYQARYPVDAEARAWEVVRFTDTPKVIGTPNPVTSRTA